MRKSLLLLVLSTWATFSLFAQEGENLDLEKAVLIGLEKNYGIKIAANNVVIAERDIKIGVGSFFMPVIDANAVRTFSKEDVEQTFVTNPEKPNKIDGAKSNTENYSIVGFYGFRPETIFTIQRLG